MKKLRVWWVPQFGMGKSFYIPVTSPEEAKKVMDILGAYDAFQLENRIKPDYCNTGGLEEYDPETGEWNDWYYETDEEYFDNVDDYCESCSKAAELENFSTEIFNQIDWKKIDELT